MIGGRGGGTGWVSSERGPGPADHTPPPHPPSQTFAALPGLPTLLRSNGKFDNTLNRRNEVG